MTGIDPTRVQAARENPQLVGDLLLSNKPAVQRTIRAYVTKRTISDSSDLFQQTLVVAVRAWTTFRGNTSPELLAWLRTIARRLTLRMNKRTAMERQIRSADAIRRDASDSRGFVFSARQEIPLDQLVANDEVDLLKQKLQSLPTLQREVLEMRHVEQLEFSEIAKRVEKSSSATRMIYIRALRRLRELVDQAEAR